MTLSKEQQELVESIRFSELPLKKNKTEVHIRLDTDVLEWFKSQGPGYQTKINAVLRAYAFGIDG